MALFITLNNLMNNLLKKYLTLGDVIDIGFLNGCLYTYFLVEFEIAKYAFEFLNIFEFKFGNVFLKSLESFKTYGGFVSNISLINLVSFFIPKLYSASV